MTIDVTGGAGGTAAELDDLDRAGGAVARTGVTVGQVAASLSAVGWDPAVNAAAFVVARHDLASAAGAAGRVTLIALHSLSVSGPDGAAGEAVRLAALGGSVAAAAAGYRAADAAAAAALDDLQDTAMGLAADALPLLATVALADVALEGPEGALHRLDALVYDQPWLVDAATGGLDGLVRGLGPSDPASAFVLGFAAARAGVTWPPRTEEDAVRVIAELAALGGGLEEDAAWSGVEVGEATRPATVPAPDGLAGLVADAVELGDLDDPARVRVTQVPQPDGSSAWILQLPGTQDWDPHPGDNPFDLSTNVALMTGEATLAAAGGTMALDDAMAAAGRSGSGDPVLLAGHSQGGILAASLASSAAFRSTHRVTGVVTMGSPIAQFPIPKEVQVLSLEHVQDPVPRLDALPNPDRPTWTTVRRDLGRGTPRGRPSAVAAHGTAGYLQTAKEVDAAVAAGGSRSLTVWSGTAAPFVGRAGTPVVSTDYHVRRTDPMTPPGR